MKTEHATLVPDVTPRAGLTPERREQLRQLAARRLRCSRAHCRLPAFVLRQERALCQVHAKDDRLNAEITRQRQHRASMREKGQGAQ